MGEYLDVAGNNTLALTLKTNEQYNGSGVFYFLHRLVANVIIYPIFLVLSLCVFVFVPDHVLKQGVLSSLRKLFKIAVKRGIDIVISVMGLLFSAIIFMVVPIVIKLDSKGSIFYKQIRVGYDRRRRNRRVFSLQAAHERRKEERRKNHSYGKPFVLYKFRTMRANAEIDSGPQWAQKNDPRVTAVGRFLRKTRIDEIPQLINVLKGEMSLVGPRPERPYFVHKLVKVVPQYQERLKVKPGITGLAQINWGYDSTIEDVKIKLNYDLDYVQNGNFLSDARIMLKTIWVVLTMKGAV